MSVKNSNKYKNLNKNYFSTSTNYRYEWTWNEKEFSLDWDFDNDKGYLYYAPNAKPILYKDIYEALDKIIIDGMSLRERLINTDFDFDFIS